MGKSWSAASRRFHLRFGALMAVYFVLLVGVVLLIDRVELAPAARYALALAPAAPLVGVVAVMGLYLRDEADEFRRLIMVQAFLAGTGVTLVVTTVWGFLEILADAPRLPLALVFPIFCMGLGLAQPLIRWWYR